MSFLKNIKPFSGIKRIAVFFITIYAAVNGYASSQSTIEKADSAYNAGNFRTALSLYNEVLDKDGASTELYYNIGNANFRLGRVGEAIVSYERSLRLDPSNTNARVNLAYVNSLLKGLPEDGSSFLSNVNQQVVSIASPDTWGVIAFVLFLAVLACVAIYLFASKTTLRKAGFFGGIVVVLLFVYAFIISWQTAHNQHRDDIGIVTSANAKLVSNPGTNKERGEKTISIPEGSKVEILDSLATPNDPVTALWYNVALNNNTQAWIDASDVEQI